MAPTITGTYTPKSIRNLAGRLEDLQGKLNALADLLERDKVESLEIAYDTAQRLAFSNLNKFITDGYDSLEAYRTERGDYGKRVDEGSIPAAAGKLPVNGRTKGKDQERSSKGKNAR